MNNTMADFDTDMTSTGASSTGASATTTATATPMAMATSPSASSSTSSSSSGGSARSRLAARRLRVVTEPRASNKMHHTRSLSELILLSPRSSPRITPRRYKRLAMDIEVSSSFAAGEGTVDLLAGAYPRSRAFSESNQDPHQLNQEEEEENEEDDEEDEFENQVNEEEEEEEGEEDDDDDDVEAQYGYHALDNDVEAMEEEDEDEEETMGVQGDDAQMEEIESMAGQDVNVSSSSSAMEQNDGDLPAPEEEPEPLSANQVDADMTTTSSSAMEPAVEDDRDRSVGGVIDMLFEIHSALKTKHLGQRTAASALAASNLVSKLAYPTPTPMPRDEQMETLENTRRMLECAICQEVFTGATEATCCGQIFCKDCIERWVSERGSCPMCRENIGFSLLVASRHAQRMANEMKVACSYCSLSLKKAMLSDHMAVCDLAPVEPPPPADVALRHLLVATARLNVAFLQRFLLAPSPPQALMTQCYIRTRGGGHYELYTQDTDTLLLTAVRRRQYDMSVTFQLFLANNLDGANASNSTTTNNNHHHSHSHNNHPLGLPSSTSASSSVSSTSSSTSSSAVAAGAMGNAMIQVARLEKNYMGSQYTMFDTTGETPVELGAVQYAATFGKSPRQMRVALPHVQELPEVDSASTGAPSWAVQPWRAAHKDDTILAQVDSPDTTRTTHLINKPPVWIESLEAYCLDFGGRVAAASVKNFLLSHPDDMDKTLMLFGRTQDRQVYSMDYAHPFSPVQAFAIALSSMDSHLVTFD